MLMLIAGLILFFGPHSIAVVAPGWRDRAVMHLRERSWKGAYSLLSGAGLTTDRDWFCARAALAAGAVHLTGVAAGRHLAADVAGVPAAASAYLPGRIQTAAKHPMLAAIKLWATAHLLVNGSLADVLLFGSFLVWAVAVRISVKRRAPGPGPGLAPVRAAPPGR